MSAPAADKRERANSVSSDISDTTYKEKKVQKKHRVDITPEVTKAIKAKEERLAQAAGTASPADKKAEGDADDGKAKGGNNNNSKPKNGHLHKYHKEANGVKKQPVYSAPTPVVASTAIIPSMDQTTTFASMGLTDELLDAVAELGYDSPSPIQQQAIPNVLAGKDLFAFAQTGTGKTAAFALPIIQLLYQRYVESGKAPASTAMKALILTPTRELAAQINDHVCALTKNLSSNADIAHHFTTNVIVGGVNTYPQIKALQKRPAIVIATPGRLLEIRKLRKTVCDFSAIEFLVLDEADRMLDMGFYPDVSKILKDLPANKQSLLFSATFTNPIRNMAQTLLRENEVAEVQVKPPPSRIRQSYYMVGRGKKDEALKFILQKNNWSQVLVFTRTQAGADGVAQKLNKAGITALAIHGGKSQHSRIESLRNFKTGRLRVLVATDVAARGIDIADLPHVINYDLPAMGKVYVHRIGRTGRAGKEGHAIALATVDEERYLENVRRFSYDELTDRCEMSANNDLPHELRPQVGEVAAPYVPKHYPREGEGEDEEEADEQIF